MDYASKTMEWIMLINCFSNANIGVIRILFYN